MKDKKLSAIFLIVFCTAQTPSIFAPTDNQPQSNWKKYALAGTAAVSLGFMGHKFLQHKKHQRIKKAEDELEEGKEQRLSNLRQSLGKGVRNKITDYVIPDFEKLAYQDREKLLHLVIPFSIKTIRDFIAEAKRHCSSTFHEYQQLSPAAQKPFEHDGHRPLYGCKFGIGNQTLIPEYRHFFEIQQRNPDLLYIKNKTHPRVLFGAPLSPGEFAVVGFTDGDIQIFLHEADRRTINNLSYDQREFIKSIYYEKLALNMTKEQTTIFNSMPAEIQERLKKNYTIHRYSIYNPRNNTSINRKPGLMISENTLKCALAWGIHALSWCRVFQSKTNSEFNSRISSNKFSFACLSLLSLFSYFASKYSEDETLKKAVDYTLLMSSIGTSLSIESGAQKWNNNLTPH